MVATSAQRAGTEEGGTFLGHPRGLYVLALTEMWERFSYYGMRALLVFFLTERFLFSDRLSFTVYGSYTALVYIAPILGGLLADGYLGCSRAVTFGGVLMIAGHFGLALDDLLFAAAPAGVQVAGGAQLQLFYLSLAFLIAGVGLLKPNISTMVGGLYPREGHLRDSGFTLFVLGINFGATISAVACGYLGQKYGWGYGFGLAGLGIFLGLTVFLRGHEHLNGLGRPPDPASLKAPLWVGLSRQSIIVLAVVLAVGVIWQLVQMLDALGYIVAATFVVATLGALVHASRHLGGHERRQLYAAIMLMSVWIVFAALIEQMGSSINLFTERVVDRQVSFSAAALWSGAGGGGLQLQSAQLQGLLPFLIIVISPFFAWLWGYLEGRGRNPSTPAKFALALLFLAAGYASITAGTFWPDARGQVHILWLCLLYFFFAIGDLLIVPVGLSAITKLATHQVVGFMMGLWMLSVAIGNYFAALIAGFSAVDLPAQFGAQDEGMLGHYQRFFGCLALGSLVAGVLALLAMPMIRRWMGGVR